MGLHVFVSTLEWGYCPLPCRSEWTHCYGPCASG